MDRVRYKFWVRWRLPLYEFPNWYRSRLSQNRSPDHAVNQSKWLSSIFRIFRMESIRGAVSLFCLFSSSTYMRYRCLETWKTLKTEAHSDVPTPGLLCTDSFYSSVRSQAFLVTVDDWKFLGLIRFHGICCLGEYFRKDLSSPDSNHSTLCAIVILQGSAVASSTCVLSDLVYASVHDLAVLPYYWRFSRRTLAGELLNV